MFPGFCINQFFMIFKSLEHEILGKISIWGAIKKFNISPYSVNSKIVLMLTEPKGKYISVMTQSQFNAFLR